MSWLGLHDVTFAAPALLWLLALLPLLALLRSKRAGAPAVLFSSLQPLRSFGVARRARTGGFWFGLFLLGLGCCILALARPQRTLVTSHTEASGTEIMLALDVSLSMLADDITIGQEQANRLEAVKKLTEEFIESRKNDRIGMVAFAGRPYLVSPLTLDHDWLQKNLQRVRTGLVENGTAIGSAIASCANRLEQHKEAKSRIIVLLTDGDNNAGKVSPTTAAEAARALGLKIYTIGVGSKGIARIPQDLGGGRIVYSQVSTEMDESSLRKVAEIGNGEFFRATDSRSLQNIYKRIDELEKSRIEVSETRRFVELFPWFLVAALACLSAPVLGEDLVRRRLP